MQHRRLKAWLALLLILQLLLGAAWAAEDDRGLIWEVLGGARPSYLVGSTHVGPPSMHPLPKTLTDAFEQADALVVEIDALSESAMHAGRLSAELGFYPPGQSLRDELSEDEWQELAQVLNEYGIHLGFANRMRPWLLGLSLSAAIMNAYGLEDKAGIDMHFLLKAKRRQMPVLELEEAEAQIRIFADLPPEQQREQLMHGIRTLRDDEHLAILEMPELWRRGEIDALYGLVKRDVEDFPELAKALLDNRNIQMVERLKSWLKDERSYFIVVGAAHMPGETGLIEGLRRAGYQVTRR